MAGTIKGITIEFRGDTSKLDKALNTIKKEGNALAKDLQAVNNALKFNPRNTELLTQKQTLLKKQVDQTEQSLKDLKAAQAELDAKGVDKNSQEYMRLRREIITTDSKLKHFKGQLAEVTRQNSKIYRMGVAFEETGKKIEGAGRKLSGLSKAAGAVVTGLGAITYKAGTTADDLNTLSKQTGISTQQLQLYAASADLVDVSVEAIAKSQQKLKKNMLGALDGTNDQAQYFQELGVEITNADGSMRDAQDVWDETIEALGKMENETQRDAYAMALMGKSANELNPLIEDGGETYRKVSKLMAKYGLEPVSQEELDAANEFNDAIDTIKLVFLQAAQIIGTKIAGYLVPIMQKIVDKVAKFAKLFSGLSGEVLAKIGAVATAVALLSPALIILGKVITGIGTAVQTATKVIGGLSKAMAFLAANPIVLVIAGITALVAAFVILWNKSEKFRDFFLGIWARIKTVFGAFVTWFNNKKTALLTAWHEIPAKLKGYFTQAWKDIKATFAGWGAFWSGLWTKVKDKFKSIGTAIGGAISSAVKGGINGVLATVENVINKGVDKINAAVDWVNKVVPGKKFDVGHLKYINLPRLAKGGVLNGAQTVIAGEAGPEAIIPLDRLFKQMEKMNAQQAAAGNVVINVNAAPGMDVNELAAAVERRLIEATKRRSAVWA